MKFLTCVMACLLAVTAMAPAQAAINTKTPRYAAMVIDADTGEVLFARNGDVKRYPASLTKMMTMYMLFDALKKGEVELTTRMKVSKFAASQPQTNISLIQGETIQVHDALRALVTRSANDVATVVAEHLGGSEAGFGVKMTAKAKALGMKGSVFRNPHGLPNVNQFVTPRDMVTLGIALRRDFPQYYDYFRTKSFTWKGRTYNTHNHMLSRYDGVDGIKTGFINMSGFNVVTSVRRDGRNLVAVVMGGQSWRDRDDHMVSILDKSFSILAERGDQPRAVANAPIPESKPLLVKTDGETVKMVRIEQVDLPAPHPALAAAPTAASTERAKVVAAELKPELKPAVTTQKTEMRMIPASYRAVEPGTLDYQLANLSPIAAAQGLWGIQVGAFSDPQSAMMAASDAVKIGGDNLKNSKIMVSNQHGTSGGIHRARLANLSEYQAKEACRQIVSAKGQCFVFRADNAKEL